VVVDLGDIRRPNPLPALPPTRRVELCAKAVATNFHDPGSFGDECDSEWNNVVVVVTSTNSIIIIMNIIITTNNNNNIGGRHGSHTEEDRRGRMMSTR
jgi:hypothetical protein